MRLESKVAGTFHRPEPTIAKLREQVGEVVMGTIQPEPQNEYDPRAMAVYADLGGHEYVHVGYIPKVDTADWHDAYARIIEGAEFACSIQVKGKTNLFITMEVPV